MEVKKRYQINIDEESYNIIVDLQAEIKSRTNQEADIDGLACWVIQRYKKQDKFLAEIRNKVMMFDLTY